MKVNYSNKSYAIKRTAYSNDVLNELDGVVFCERSPKSDSWPYATTFKTGFPSGMEAEKYLIDLNKEQGCTYEIIFVTQTFGEIYPGEEQSISIYETSWFDHLTNDEKKEKDELDAFKKVQVYGKKEDWTIKKKSYAIRRSYYSQSGHSTWYASGYSSREMAEVQLQSLALKYPKAVIRDFNPEEDSYDVTKPGSSFASVYVTETIVKLNKDWALLTPIDIDPYYYVRKDINEIPPMDGQPYKLLP